MKLLLLSLFLLPLAAGQQPEPKPEPDYSDYSKRVAWDLHSLKRADQWNREMAALLEKKDTPEGLAELRLRFDGWAKAWGKVYPPMFRLQRSDRFILWLDRLKQVVSENLADFSYWSEMNFYADRTYAEFDEEFDGGFNPEPDAMVLAAAATGRTTPVNVASLKLGRLPRKVDWVAAGKVPAVRRQEELDCWAHAAAVVIESAWAIRNNKKASTTVKAARVSVQQLTGSQRVVAKHPAPPCLADCTGPAASCAGTRSMKYAFDISYQMGSVPERTYPYKDCAPQRCQRGLVSKVPSARRIRPPRAPGSRSIPASTNVTALIAAVARAPVAFAACASNEAFRDYAGGVLAAPKVCNCQLDHVMAIVGYNTKAPVPYWLVQNSRGPSWGAAGRIKIRMDGAGPGMCNMYLMPPEALL
ncbi:hypothetical protein CHLNCDRAFT_54361 [Chlorella variabilis]|uniref:Peptidase C1A papain C-terminal domain-containing protein n=1 Tax=Chlorella variabilis TaxID=554065 RepID=E1ZNL1_CHLVA|nr:hypothetical protein CHLNCDRAFT_54361 [Chlorella variabilis]EFN52624.1 hypothetical protein CHLNCDRAFT_54361 [Chlorella variabilis]|eukprot:XP_005844726.1 hypothetical protein CHLNCDRAFT_54361 [Chlorella variabilis]